MTRDAILVRGLEVLAYCGVLPEERQRRQPFSVDVEVLADLVEAGATDDLGATINYGDLCEAIGLLASTARYGLLERFAQEIAELVLAYDRVEAVTVEVRKLRPPVPLHLDYSGVRIHRIRG